MADAVSKIKTFKKKGGGGGKFLKWFFFVDFSMLTFRGR
jgi:hypothetical protein